MLIFFFFNDPATTEIYTLSLHDALPISDNRRLCECFSHRGPELLSSHWRQARCRPARSWQSGSRDRKSTRLNSSHVKISYAVFCLKKKKKIQKITDTTI